MIFTDLKAKRRVSAPFESVITNNTAKKQHRIVHRNETKTVCIINSRIYAKRAEYSANLLQILLLASIVLINNSCLHLHLHRKKDQM